MAGDTYPDLASSVATMAKNLGMTIENLPVRKELERLRDQREA